MGAVLFMATKLGRATPRWCFGFYSSTNRTSNPILTLINHIRFSYLTTCRRQKLHLYRKVIDRKLS